MRLIGQIAVDLFDRPLSTGGMSRAQAQAEFVQIIENMKNQVVEVPGRP